MALYHPVGSEVQTQEIMRDAISRGVQVLLPRILGDDMVFCAVGGPEDLEMGRFGIMVPKERCPTCCDMDVVVVPAVGVAPDGHRLGYGHGYYDRFLGGSGATSIAVAYRRQVVGSIPFDGHDVRVHWVATESGAFRADHRAA